LARVGRSLLHAAAGIDTNGRRFARHLQARPRLARLVRRLTEKILREVITRLQNFAGLADA